MKNLSVIGLELESSFSWKDPQEFSIKVNNVFGYIFSAES